jgi:NADPH-dependent 2,4-dienoyl-CoA reductase/sulfur reductase-like enzyme
MFKRRNKTSAKSDAADVSDTTRRDFLLGGATSLGPLGLATSSISESAPAVSHFDYEADVVVCGGGAAGLVCAIRARDLGNRVIVVEANFDVGGKMSHSGGEVSLGGGDPLQV